ncbi:MAG: hypothetical protein EAZ08_14180 [Cytophagales bacterium]|nr:MAG: hypothetical protein EAZ08_14180 [Cytophagales bacterium]
MKKEIKGLRKLSTEEMEKVKGGYFFPVLDVCHIAEVLVYYSSFGEESVKAADNYMSLRGICW